MSNIRIVLTNGKYSFHKVVTDEEGDVTRIGNEISFESKSVKDLVKVLEEALQGATQNVLVLNSCNARILSEE